MANEKEGFKKIYSAGKSIKTKFMLSTLSESYLYIHIHYKFLPINCLAFRKTYEAVKMGLIYNPCRVYQKFIAYITVGQRVQGIIEFIVSRNLSNITLRTGSA